MEQQLKKYSIGYNTISSVDGVINARGVKSYPNNLEIYGYTHEIGTGEKSPDNPYILKSLDSGNANLYSKDKIIRNTVGKTTTTGKVAYGIELPHPKTGYYCVKSDPSTEYPLTYNLYDIETNVLVERGWNIAINSNNSDTGRIIKVDDGLGLLLYDCRDNNYNAFTNRTNLMILDSPIMPDEYITDEHSIVLSNNDKTIQVPTPIALHSVNGKNDILTKNSSGVWGIKVRTSVFNSNDYIDTLKYHGESSTGTHVYRIGDISPEEINGNISVCISNFLKIVPKNSNEDNIAKLFHIDDKLSMYIRYQHSLYPVFSSVEVLKEFLLENPIEIIFPADAEAFIPLSDYAQDLLNSFELQNQNEISVEGNPDIKISGYIQK